jgi:hypothetical protein
MTVVNKKLESAAVSNVDAVNVPVNKVQVPAPGTSVLAGKALEIALGYEGVKELPGNRGEFVDACLTMVGVPVGNPWCQAFVYRVYREASEALKVGNPVPRVGGVLNHWRQTPGRKINKGKERPIAGDVLIYDHGKGLGHIAILVQHNEDGTIRTVEGNTSLSGSRNGDGVYVLNRRRLDDKLLVGWIRY